MGRVAHPIAREGGYVHFKTLTHARRTVKKVSSTTFVVAFELGFVPIEQQRPTRSLSSFYVERGDGIELKNVVRNGLVGLVD